MFDPCINNSVRAGDLACLKVLLEIILDFETVYNRVVLEGGVWDASCAGRTDELRDSSMTTRSSYCPGARPLRRKRLNPAYPTMANKIPPTAPPTATPTILVMLFEPDPCVTICDGVKEVLEEDTGNCDDDPIEIVVVVAVVFGILPMMVLLYSRLGRV